MAKIIIGNVRGKDGRGITKIVKTASTGAVDTYTITYTDSTTSTFTINNSDNISIQRQIVPSAAVESSATASQAYAAGDYVVVGGVLRKVTSSIAKGSTIGASNSTATTVAGELSTVAGKLAQPLMMTKKFSASQSGLGPNETVTLDLDCKVSGWVPLMVADVSSNHNGSFALTESLILSSGRVHVTYRSLANWAEMTIRCTVLYVRAGVAGTIEHLTTD